jgi:hypothetical protein
MRSLRRVLAGLLLAATALLLPMSGMAHGVTLSECLAGGGRGIGVGNGYYYCKGGVYDGHIID